MPPLEFDYAETVNQNLICSICFSPFIEPITVSCQHTFCLGCLSEHLSTDLSQESREREPKCPLCSSAIDMLWTQSKIVSLMCEELKVFCNKRKEGCTWMGERQFLDSHSKKRCDYAVRSCTWAGCGYIGAELSKHVLVCDYALVSCDHCSIELSRKELEAHVVEEKQCDFCHSMIPVCKLSAHQSTTCPDMLLHCDLSHFGCPWSGKRKEIPLHQAKCSYESIKGFLLLHQKAYRELQAENLGLKKTISVLESQILDLNVKAGNGHPTENDVMMINMARDFSLMKNELDSLVLQFGQMELKREGEHLRLRDEIHSLRTHFQNIQAHFFTISMQKGRNVSRDVTPTKL